MGGTLAEHLANEANDITVVDTDTERLRDLGDRLGTSHGDRTLLLSRLLYAKPVLTMPTCWWP